jgi:hypothetical protein
MTGPSCHAVTTVTNGWKKYLTIVKIWPSSFSLSLSACARPSVLWQLRALLHSACFPGCPSLFLTSPIIRAHYCLSHTHRFRNVLGNPPSFFFVFFPASFWFPFRVPLRPRRAPVSHRPSESSCLIAACFALLILQNWLAGPIVVVFLFFFNLKI